MRMPKKELSDEQLIELATPTVETIERADELAATDELIEALWNAETDR